MMLDAGMQALALALACAAAAASLGAIMARSLFAMCVQIATAGLLSAAVVLLLGADDGALGLALFAAAWAPLLLLAGMLLSARSAKSAVRKRPWLSAAAAAAVAVAVLWPLAELPPTPARGGDEIIGLGFWLAPLVFAGAAACVALLGYGERGALDGGRGG